VSSTVGAGPDVSFVVPCYNYGRYLRACLDSILGQQETTKNYEIIAIDDASTDDTGDILMSIRDSRVRVVRHPQNLGHVATVNEGLGLARGRFIARIDPDDRYRPSFLATALGVFEKHADVGVVYGDAAIIDESGAITAGSSDPVHGGRDFKGNLFLHLLEVNSICAPTVLGRRECWERGLPIPSGLAFNDWYFNIVMARHADFYYVGRVLADYRVHGQNHHTKIVEDRTEETSIFRLLDRVYGEREASDVLERAKWRVRGRVYGRQYLTLADKYFGLGMNADARRCYEAAARHRPAYLLKPGVQRRLAATILGRERYEASKALFKTLSATSRN